MTLTAEFVRRLPKVMLHDHLDGGLRPATVIELAKEQGYDKLPTNDPEELNEWFQRGAQRGSLPMYLEGFEHTSGVMQTAAALERVAYETLEDMLHDGVFYLETRFAPLLHTEKGLSVGEVVDAVLKGLERGKADFGIHYGVILVALRTMSAESSMEVARLSVQYRSQGVVGFDFAGAEKGYPPSHHIEAFRFITQNHFYTTIHAGEGFGVESIRQAVIDCGAHRIGHGTRITEDIQFDEQGQVVALGPLAQYVLDRRIPLEMCLTSNVHTGGLS
jgi:adenosine deaminase